MFPLEYFIIISILATYFSVKYFYKNFYYEEVIPEGYEGLLFIKGNYIETLKPGLHKFYQKNKYVKIYRFSLKSSTLSINGQEVLTKDLVNIKLNVLVIYRISDTLKAYSSAEVPTTLLYNAVQLKVREVIAGEDMDDMLSTIKDINEKMLAESRKEAEKFGIELETVSIKDVMLSGELKNAYSKIVTARKEAQALQEKTKGETAALRNLVNASKLIDENPNIMKLRKLEVLKESGNTLIVNIDEPKEFIPVKKD